MHRRHRFLTVLFLVLLAVAGRPVRAGAEMAAEDFRKAQSLHRLKCAKCHKLYRLSDYEPDQWLEWMEKMRQKAKLSQEQYGLLTRYFEAVRGGQKE